MDERRGAATEGTAKAAAAKRTAARRKPTTKGGAKSVGGPASGKSGTSAKPAASGAGRRSAESGQAQVPHSPLTAPGAEPQQQDRGLRRAIFLAELAEAKELRRRVAPRRARAAELHARVLRTFRY
jgi:hypothetical protein